MEGNHVRLWTYGGENLENDIPNSHGGYLGKLKETQAALHAMARESIEQTLAKSREGVNERRAEIQVGKGDMVMLRNC